MNKSKSGCIVISLSHLFELYKAVTPQEQNNALQDELGIANKQYEWPEDGVSYDFLVSHIKELDNRPFGYLNDFRGPHQIILMIGSLENIRKINWTDTGFGQSFKFAMKDYPKDNFKGWVVFATTNLSASIAHD